MFQSAGGSIRASHKNHSAKYFGLRQEQRRCIPDIFSRQLTASRLSRRSLITSSSACLRTFSQLTCFGGCKARSVELGCKRDLDKMSLTLSCEVL